MGNKSYIITPTWNNEEYTLRCFDSIQKNTKNYKIIWIDNGSSEESRNKIKEFLDENNVPYELILNKENLGFVKATNQGMKRAIELGAKYIVLQNNDTEVYDGWLNRMIKVAKSDEIIGLVGPITSPCKSCQSIEYLREHNPNFNDLPNYDNNPKSYSEIIRKKYENQSCELDIQLAFFSTLIKREVVENIGYLSEEFGVGFGDDDDYSIRARKAGWILYLAKDVFVFHNHRTTFKSIYSEEKISEMLKENKKKYENKHIEFYKKKLEKDKLGNKERELDILKKRNDVRNGVSFMKFINFQRIKSKSQFLKNGIKFVVCSPLKFIKKYLKYE